MQREVHKNCVSTSYGTSGSLASFPVLSQPPCESQDLGPVLCRHRSRVRKGEGTSKTFLSIKSALEPKASLLK